LLAIDKLNTFLQWALVASPWLAVIFFVWWDTRRPSDEAEDHSSSEDQDRRDGEHLQGGVRRTLLPHGFPKGYGAKKIAKYRRKSVQRFFGIATSFAVIVYTGITVALLDAQKTANGISQENVGETKKAVRAAVDSAKAARDQGNDAN
jgi:hypothetical protein